MMEKKRKLPARAAARAEQGAKKRNATPRESSSTPAPTPAKREPTQTPPPPPPPPLPTSILPGQPLPTVEEAQPEDLSTEEFQTIYESGVLAESLSRSRHRWVSEGLFEKFWTKPYKRKGVLHEEPGNPPKDSMTRLGNVIITIEPHIVEATTYAVKLSKLPPEHPLHKQQQQQEQQQEQQQQKQQQQHQQQQEQQKQQQRHQQQKQQQQQQQQQLKQSTGDQQNAQPVGVPKQPSTSSPSPLAQAPAPPPTPPQPSSMSTPARPVLQYGPPSGSMAPPPPSPPTSTPSASATSPRPKAEVAQSPQTVSGQVSISRVPSEKASSAAAAVTLKPAPSKPTPTITSPVPLPSSSKPAPKEKSPVATSQTSPLPPAAAVAIPTAAPRPTPSTSLAPTPSATSVPASVPSAGNRPPPIKPKQALVPPAKPMSSASTSIPPTARPRIAGPASGVTSRPSTPASRPPAAPAPKPAANDPVIALLAQKASGDPALRDLMKRVAVGQAKDGELAQFQKIIDQLNADYKQRGGQQGPSADRLLVDGRTVKYFADEVRTILDIVLASNPQQKSTELRPPPRSDPLVVLLVKTALEDKRTKDMIRRIAEGRPGFTDSQDLKEILDRLHRDAKTVPKGPPAVLPQVKKETTNGVLNGHPAVANVPVVKQATPPVARSKILPNPTKTDVGAVVFDFGSGDRYLFPRYSILEFLPTRTGQQVIASFLIVRKGSTSDYGGDPTLDYYQPITIRLQTASGRHLENLTRAVAPQEEVKRYMNDVMDNMTRAEYVLLAMRLPRGVKEGDKDGGASTGSKTLECTPKPDEKLDGTDSMMTGVLWTTRAANKALGSPEAIDYLNPEQESQMMYEQLIRSVAEKEDDELE